MSLLDIRIDALPVATFQLVQQLGESDRTLLRQACEFPKTRRGMKFAGYEIVVEKPEISDFECVLQAHPVALCPTLRELPLGDIVDEALPRDGSVNRSLGLPAPLCPNLSTLRMYQPEFEVVGSEMLGGGDKRFAHGFAIVRINRSEQR